MADVEFINALSQSVDRQIVLQSGGVGASSGWLPALGWGERFMAQLDTGGTSASVALDGSNDGSTSAGQLGTWSLDVANQQVVTPPIKSPYAFIRLTVVSATGTVTLGRGA
jgi:hypothetical protein